jgi:predicted nucleic acid-binding protein
MGGLLLREKRQRKKTNRTRIERIDADKRIIRIEVIDLCGFGMIMLSLRFHGFPRRKADP